MGRFKPKKQKLQGGSWEKIQIIDYDDKSVLIKTPWGQLQRVGYEELYLSEKDTQTLLKDLGKKQT